MKSKGKQKVNPENFPENQKDTTGKPEENKENLSENHKDRTGEPEENKEEATNVSTLETGKLVQNSFKVTEATKANWEEYSKHFRTKGEAFKALLDNLTREPEIVEKEVIKEVEIIKEVEVIKEVPVSLKQGEIIIRFDEKTETFSRKSRKYLRRDGVIKSDEPGEALSELVNRSIIYFLKNKYDHIINPL